MNSLDQVSLYRYIKTGVFIQVYKPGVFIQVYKPGVFIQVIKPGVFIQVIKPSLIIQVMKPGVLVQLGCIHTGDAIPAAVLFDVGNRGRGSGAALPLDE